MFCDIHEVTLWMERGRRGKGGGDGGRKELVIYTHQHTTSIPNHLGWLTRIFNCSWRISSGIHQCCSHVSLLTFCDLLTFGLDCFKVGDNWQGREGSNQAVLHSDYERTHLLSVGGLRFNIQVYCKNIWVTSTIFWSSQLHACCVCDSYITNFKGGYTKSVVEKLLPLLN